MKKRSQKGIEREVRSIVASAKRSALSSAFKKQSWKSYDVPVNVKGALPYPVVGFGPGRKLDIRTLEPTWSGVKKFMREFPHGPEALGVETVKDGYLFTWLFVDIRNIVNENLWGVRKLKRYSAAVFVPAWAMRSINAESKRDKSISVFGRR